MFSEIFTKVYIPPLFKYKIVLYKNDTVKDSTTIVTTTNQGVLQKPNLFLKIPLGYKMELWMINFKEQQ